MFYREISLVSPVIHVPNKRGSANRISAANSPKAQAQ
jgi:hypothetical protein